MHINLILYDLLYMLVFIMSKNEQNSLIMKDGVHVIYNKYECPKKNLEDMYFLGKRWPKKTFSKFLQTAPLDSSFVVHMSNALDHCAIVIDQFD